MNIPKWPVAGERELGLLRQVLASGQWGGFHELVARFEKTFAEFQHCAWGVSAANGTVTLEMALEAADIGPSDEVIVPAISFISTASAVTRVGATPVFADIEPLTFNLDPARAAAAVTSRTRAILAVHFGGPLADMDRLAALARDRGILLLEDAAHAHGSEWNGRRAGSFGRAGSFSFQNSKVMTAGEGGILVSNDREFLDRAWSIANCGRRRGEGWFHHYTPGSNYRLTAWQAAVLLAQLERLPAQIELRARNAEILRRELTGVPGLRFQQAPPQVNVHSHYLMLGRIDAARAGKTRNEFHQALTARGVPCTPFYPHPLYGNPMYASGGCRVEPCPVAEECIGDAFWLPCRALMGDEEITREIAAAIRAAIR
ncbi:MAG: DegT/DnrJ/EryC1/StrS family aminotransferase [Acidobacteria bacterium]|nr:DegT/DnrJ/EryC1/StrS family aminotransferase [Acidobacteriota bacterium]